MSTDAKFTIKIVYMVYQIREGLLKEVEDYHYRQREYVYSQYGYDTMEAAIEAIATEGGDDLVILPMATKVWE